MGYIKVNGDKTHELGYGLKGEFWHNGLMRKSLFALLNKLKVDGVKYITATHDVKNYRSGNVMKSVGMKYLYSYRILWELKKVFVTFRLYILNLDGNDNREFNIYWDSYKIILLKILLVSKMLLRETVYLVYFAFKIK